MEAQSELLTAPTGLVSLNDNSTVLDAGLHWVLLSYHWNALKFAFLHLDPSTHDGEEYKSEGIYLEPNFPDKSKF